MVVRSMENTGLREEGSPCQALNLRNSNHNAHFRNWRIHVGLLVLQTDKQCFQLLPV